MSDFIDPLGMDEPQAAAIPTPAPKVKTRADALVEKLLAWDGRDARLRDEIRARLWCIQNDVYFDSIVGRIEGTEDKRRLLYSETGDPMQGVSIDMDAVNIWPWARHQAGRWARFWAWVRS